MELFHGALTALVTPFVDGKVDEQSFASLIEDQIANGIHGIIPCGTTGESATLGFDEHKRLIELAVQTVAGRVPVIAGTGANNTLEAIEFTESAKESGADAVLSVAPYYNKPSQEGIYQHFKTVAQQVDIPMFLYNVPGRTVVNILPETVARLSRLDNVIGIKEACGDLNQISDVLRLCPEDFIVLSGDDFTAMPTIFLGGRGVISVVSNVTPRAMADLMEAALGGDIERSRELHFRLYTLMKLMFANPSPAPAKRALRLLNKISDDFSRLPITPVEPATAKALEDALAELGLC